MPNAAEHIVETYFRIVRHCFTRPDVKILNGNNRQIDLLAYCLITGTTYHVETAVTHELVWQWDVSELVEKVDYKFFGVPGKRDPNNPRTDAAKGKTYLEQIEKTYSLLGVKSAEVTRVFCCWVPPEAGAEQKIWQQSAANKFPPERFEFLSFRDEVIPKLREAIGRANYDDMILRTFSLLAQYEKQLSQRG